MPAGQTIVCPECEAINRLGSHTCRLCGAALDDTAKNKPRMQQKLLRRTDFIAASKANQAATRKLILTLLAIAVVLGYLVGWTGQVFVSQPPPQATDPVLYVSHWGIVAALGLLAISLLWTWIAFKRGDRIVMKMTGAHAVDRDSEPQLHNIVDEMALAAGIITPAVYIIETDAMNAFATGMSPKNASIGVTRGLLNQLNRDELQGVVAHEMGHIVNWDIRYATAVSVLVGLILLLSDFVLRSSYYSGGGMARSRGSSRGEGNAGAILFIIMLVFAILAPLIARLVQMAVSRQREFLADATSVRLTRNPHGLISALNKLATQPETFKGANRATQHLFIVNPFRNFSEKASSLMATHPPLERRIRRLYNLGNKDY